MSTIFHLLLHSWIDGALATLSPPKYGYFDPLLFAGWSNLQKEPNLT